MKKAIRDMCMILTVGLVALSAHTASAQAATVAVGNNSFETEGTQTGNWYSLPAGGDWDGAAHPYSILDISQVNVHFPTLNAPDGNNVLNLSVVGTMTQDLGYTINAGDLISLSFYIGNSAKEDDTTAKSDITATIMLDGSNASPNLLAVNDAADGQWALKTFEWTADAGGELGISFDSGTGGWLDNVSVTVKPPPAGTVFSFE